MAASTRQIRDDVRDAIAGLAAVTGRGIDPAAVWVPQFDRKEDTLPAILVAPVRREQAMIARGQYETETLIQVAVLESLKDNPEAAGNAGHALLEAIIEGLLGKRIGGTTNATCTAAETKTLTAGEWWREQRMFGAVVELRLR